MDLNLKEESNTDAFTTNKKCLVEFSHAVWKRIDVFPETQIEPISTSGLSD